MYILILHYSDTDRHLVYFNDKKRAKKAYKRFKKKSRQTENYAILAKVIKEFEPE